MSFPRTAAPAPLTLAVAVISLVLAACSSGLVGDADGELVIGTLLPLTGSEADEGIATREAVDAQLSELRAASEFDRIQIRIVHTDVRSDGLLMTAALDELLKNNVDVVIGPPTHVQNEAAVAKLAASGTILYLPLEEATAAQAQMMADAVIRDGHTAVTLVASDSAATKVGEAMSERFVENGGEPIPSVRIPTVGDGLDLAVAEIAATAGTATVLLGVPEPQRLIVAMERAGVGPTSRQVYVVGNTHEVVPGVGLRLVEPASPLQARVLDRLVLAALATADAGTDDPATVAASLSMVAAGETACSSFANCLTQLRDGSAVAYSATAENGFSSVGLPIQVPYRMVAFTPEGEVNDELTRIVTSS